MNQFYLFLIKYWRIVPSISVILAFVGIRIVHSILSKNPRFNVRKLPILGIVIVLFTVVKYVVSDKSFTYFNEWVIVMSNALLYAYSALFLLDTYLKGKRKIKIHMSNSFYIELSFALLLGSILIPLFFTENFGVKDYTIIFFGIKYINYLAFLADLMTVIGILIAFRELYNRIEIENEFFSAIDQKMTVLDNIDLYDDIKKITNQHKQYIDTNAYEYRLLYEHYREKKKWLDFAIYYRELQGILKDISSEYNDLISDELIKAYIGKRQIKIKKRAIKMKVIKKWVKSEIKRTK